MMLNYGGNFESMSNDELNEVIKKIKAIKRARNDEEVQKVQTEVREYLYQLERQRFHFYVPGSYGNEISISADKIFVERDLLGD